MRKKAVKIVKKKSCDEPDYQIHLDPINGHFHAQLDHVKSRHQNKSSCVFDIFNRDAVARYIFILI